jgi:hypothetical protein
MQETINDLESSSGELFERLRQKDENEGAMEETIRGLEYKLAEYVECQRLINTSVVLDKELLLDGHLEGAIAHE